MSKKTWNLDLTHSEIGFKIRHMMISNVAGTFGSATATVLANEADFSDAEIHFSAEVNSIDTSNDQRDEHLKSADFFDVEKFPVITFNSTSLEKKSESEYVAHGNLTIRDITRPVSLKTDYAGTVVDPYGQTKAGFELHGTISRGEFGLTWSAVTEAGGVVVSDEVKLSLSIQVVAAQ
jgi:polyisoprenoid-binding protein YceI